MEYSDFDVWEFKRDGENRWLWRRLTADGEVRIASRAPFGEVEECIADARRCGYLGSPIPEAAAT
jgi:hypothetical protein